MRFRICLALASVVLALATPRAIRAAITEGYVSTGSESVVPGLDHEWGTTQTEAARQHVNLLRLTNGAANMHFETALPLGRVNAREETTHQAAATTYAGHRVVGAVNGDFWATGSRGYAPIGMNVRNAELISTNHVGRPAVGFNADGSTIIGTPASAIELTLPDTTIVQIAAINQLRDPDAVVMYTPRFGEKTATDSSGVELVISGVLLPLTVTGSYVATVDEVRPGVGNSGIPAGKLVLSATGTGATAVGALKAGDQLGLSMSITAGWAGVANSIGGGPIVVHEGAPGGPYTERWADFPNPRTAVGLTADGGVIVVVVDGRSESSGGMILGDLAELLISLGAVEAINLDGGGSSTMAVDPAGPAPLGIVNHPSQGYERRVNTSLQLVSTLPADGLPSVSQPIVLLKAGVAAGKTDAVADVTWSASDDGGQIVSSELQRLGGDGSWHDVPLSDRSAQHVGLRLKFDKRTQFRVRVTDNDGNVSSWVVGPTYHLMTYNERSPDLVVGGRWLVHAQRNAIGGHYARSNIKAGAELRIDLAFAGIQVAWVGQTESMGGRADISIDGAPLASIDMHSSTTRPRMVMFVSAPASGPIDTPPAERTIRIHNVSGGARPIVNLDAFLVLVAE